MRKTKKATCARQSAQIRYVIVRCRDAGVHAGVYVSHEGREVKLHQARRLWRWQVPMGAPAFLSGVATHGIDATNSIVGGPCEIVLLDACEILDCSDTARDAIKAAPTAVRTR